MHNITLHVSSDLITVICVQKCSPKVFIECRVLTGIYLWFEYLSDIPCPEGLQIEGVAMKDLLSELQEVTDWFYFGVCLGVHEWKLKAIMRDYEDTEECKREMLFIWMNKEVATWSKVIRALAEIEMERLALAIATKYGT